MPVADVARRTVADALAATQLGDLDAAALQTAGIPSEEVRRIRAEAVAVAAAPIDAGLQQWLLEARPAPSAGLPPAFVARLAAQPRAGATCPGRGRLVLEPPEDHAEHCAIVAISGVILAPVWGARVETVFLAALAHHLHNALLPDAGFAGEVLLGEWLQPAMARATTLALDDLSPARARRSRRPVASCRMRRRPRVVPSTRRIRSTGCCRSSTICAPRGPAWTSSCRRWNWFMPGR
ncbi:hypothetical protein ACFQY5_11765 [Paeniroseomonas aquatica]|uniref:hypothetical protein n=1 Tax=Paeniroseomonas aquatica TaxID=373043 RepID=UPI0036104CDF